MIRTEENILWSFAPHDIAVILRLVGELPLEGPAPAVANALRQALGLEFNEAPFTPESILRRWEEAAS